MRILQICFWFMDIHSDHHNNWTQFSSISSLTSSRVSCQVVLCLWPVVGHWFTALHASCVSVWWLDRPVLWWPLTLHWQRHCISRVLWIICSAHTMCKVEHRQSAILDCRQDMVSWKLQYTVDRCLLHCVGILLLLPCLWQSVLWGCLLSMALSHFLFYVVVVDLWWSISISVHSLSEVPVYFVLLVITGCTGTHWRHTILMWGILRARSHTVPKHACTPVAGAASASLILGKDCFCLMHMLVVQVCHTCPCTPLQYFGV